MHPEAPIHREQTISSDLDAVHHIQEEIEQALSKGFGFDEKEVFAVRLALEEALVNAVKHGNEFDPAKTVKVVYTLKPEVFDIRITDQGAGFDPEQVPDPTDFDNLDRPCGRGVFLIKAYMSDVSYHDGGKTVAMVKRHQKK